jgi:UDP-3-O-[3-hydroxymyristoyl] glucosamine N-acyltransferase
MQLTAHQIGILLEGTIEGNPEVTVNQLAKIEDAKQGSLSFLANSKYEQFVYGSGASIIIVNDDFVPSQPIRATLIRVKNAYSAFSVLLEKYDELLKSNKTGIEEPSFIHPSAEIGKDVYIAALAYIGPNVKIGDGSKIYPNTLSGR